MPIIDPAQYGATDLVTIRQACGILGVCRRTIYNWIAHDKVQYCRIVSGSVRIVKASLFQPQAASQQRRQEARR